jgi:hypothetical protein
MTKTEFVDTFLYGLDGQDKVQFDKIVALLEHLADRGCGGHQALEADTVGVAYIEAGTGFVTVTVKTAATDIIHLPAVADVEIGHQVRGVVPATGCELRVHDDDDTTVYINNNNTTVNEIALAVGMSFHAVLTSKTTWIVTCFAAAGTVTAPTPD